MTGMLKMSFGACCKENGFWEPQGANLENRKEALFFSPWPAHMYTHTNAHNPRNVLAHRQSQGNKPSVFVCFILAAFQVFKILAHILN